jgi:hypothetical protein
MTARRPPRWPARWFDAGSFALGVLTEALAELRRTRPARRSALERPAASAAPIQIDSAPRRPRPTRRRPPVRGARRPKP